MKKVKEYLKDYHEDVNPDIDVNELKKHIKFNKPKDKTERKFWNFKLVFSIVLTILFVIPLTCFVTMKYVSNQFDDQPFILGDEDPDTIIMKYLKTNYDKYIPTSIQTIVLTDHVLVSFYLGEINNQIYLVSQIHAAESYQLKINLNSEKIMEINMNEISMDSYKVANDEFSLELLLSKNGQIIGINTVTFDLLSYKNFLNQRHTHIKI